MMQILKKLFSLGIFLLLVSFIIAGIFENSFFTRPQDLPFAIKYYLDDYFYKRNRNLRWKTLEISEPRGKVEIKPTPPTYRYESGAATVGDEIYVVGGITLPSVYNATKKVEAYYTKTGKWNEKTEFPNIIHHVNIVSSGEKLYVAGGNGFRVSTYNTLFEYDPKKDLWTRLPNMPTSRAAMSLSYIDGKIYAIGGAVGPKPFNNNEVYDIKNNTWTTKSPMPTAREHIASAVVDGKIYVFGGLVKSHISTPLNITEEYDPIADTWLTKASMPVGLSGFAAVEVGKSIYIIGGQQDYAVSNMIFEYRPDENKWYRRSDLPIARYSPAVTVHDEKIHIIGGSSQIHGYRLLQDHLVFTP